MASPVSRCSIGTAPIGSLFQAATSLAITMSGERLFSPRLPLPRFGFWLTIQLIMLSAELPKWRPIPPAVRRRPRLLRHRRQRRRLHRHRLQEQTLRWQPMGAWLRLRQLTIQASPQLVQTMGIAAVLVGAVVRAVGMTLR